MSDLSTVIQAMVTDENDTAYFVQKQGETYRLPKTPELALSIGDVVTGFVYENTEHKKMMTTTIPAVTNQSYGWGTVTQVRRDLGVFVDIGLPDKDMVVSLDELPSMKELWPKKNNRLYVTLTKDKKDRTWATMGDGNDIALIANRADQSMKNKDFDAIVTQVKLVGTYLYDEATGYRGFLHPSERLYEPTLGETIHVRVIGIRPDGVLNVSMRPRAYEAISDDAAMILAMLENRPSHSLPYWDKTDPAIIKDIFGISKGQFKRALGSLMKAKKITQSEGGITLVTQED